MRTVLFGLVAAGLFGGSACLAEDPKPVTYDDHISAIVKRHCRQCHGEGKKEAGLDLSSFDALKKGGSGGAVVVAGRSSASRLLEVITAENPDERMPPNNDPLPPEQIALIKTWIDTGLRQNAGSTVATSTLTFKPMAAGSKPSGPPAMPEKLPPFEPAKTARPFPVLAMTASPRASLVASASYEAIRFLDPVSGNTLGALPFPEGEPLVLRFSQSGSLLLAAGGRPVQSGNVVLFDVKTGKRLAILGDELDAVLAADIAPDERKIALGGSGRIVKVYETEGGKLVQSLNKHTDWITATAYSPDNKLLATADRIGNIHLWDAASGGIVLSLSEHKGAVRSLAWRSDGKILASCGEDGLIVWWDVSTGFPVASKADAHPPVRPAGTFGKIANGVLDANFGPGGELVTCGRDRMIRVWSASGQETKSYSLDSQAESPQPATARVRVIPTRVVLTHDGTQIVAGDSAGQIYRWKVENAAPAK